MDKGKILQYPESETIVQVSRKISSPISPSMSSSPSSKPPPEPETRNWLDLPRDVTSTILLKLGPIEILNSAQRVCKLWRSISMEPLMWRTIDMQNLGDPDVEYNLDIMCRHAIDRSCGQLVDINVEHFGTDDLLDYISDSTCHLRRLRLFHCYRISDEGLSKVANKLPWLEELEISMNPISSVALEAIGQSCPLLKSFKFNVKGFKRPLTKRDKDAFAIAKTMPGLRHLQLLGNRLTNDGLLAILDGCPHLEFLDLRLCFNVILEGNLERRCVEQIKDFWHPYAPIDDYPYGPEMFHDDEHLDEDYQCFLESMF